MNTEFIIIAAAVLFILSALFMRNTHPYSGSREERFESKMVRRRIGIFLLVLALGLVGISILTYMLINRE
jgi:nitrogen fixation/metabolism regulation signal transduction histidine kinase